MKYILIIGAKSDIALELAKRYAENGYNLYLAARDVNSIEHFACDINLRKNVEVVLNEFDITDFLSHDNFYNSLDPKPEGVIVCSGYMVPQEECENDWQKTINTINVNFTGAVSILNIIANDFEKSKRGFIIGISSVAGDRGRKTNYIYGSSKSAFTQYLSGLRNRLFSKDVSVLTVKPGFVYTKMTIGLVLPKKLTSTAADVAKDIYLAQQNKTDVLYTKWIWKYIMTIINFIPEWLFKKMSI
jgi:decaprenylphospho-beta-D-erythro-pentofuranosid-2-ulose 2-reductase